MFSNVFRCFQSLKMGLDSRQAVAGSCKNLGGSQELIVELSLLDPIELEFRFGTANIFPATDLSSFTAVDFLTY